TRTDIDDLNVLTLVDGCDHAGGGDIAVAEAAGDGIAHRSAAAGARDYASDVESVLLEHPLFERDAPRRARGVRLVLRDDNVLGHRRRGRSDAERDDERSGDDLHAVLLQAFFSTRPS